MHASWAIELFAAHRLGRLNGDELWCVMLACFEEERADRVVATVLRSFVAAPVRAPAPSAPNPAMDDEYVVVDTEADAPVA